MFVSARIVPFEADPLRSGGISDCIRSVMFRGLERSFIVDEVGELVVEDADDVVSDAVEMTTVMKECSFVILEDAPKKMANCHFIGVEFWFQ